MAQKVVIGDAELWLGDCLEILPTLPKAGVVITDPPYGLALRLGMGGGHKGDGGKWAGIGISGDDDVTLRDAVLEAAGAPFAAFASPRRPAPPKFRGVVVWDKGEHTGAGDLSFPWKPSFELVYINGAGWSSERRGGGIVKFNAVAGCVADRNDGARFHPFEKPTAVMGHFIERAPSGIVCDPFMGSGTTGVACVQLGRKFIGIEIEPRYFDIACRRIEEAYAQGRLFEPEQPKPEQQALAIHGGLAL